jgi:hypothetical protein
VGASAILIMAQVCSVMGEGLLMAQVCSVMGEGLLTEPLRLGQETFGER